MEKYIRDDDDVLSCPACDGPLTPLSDRGDLIFLCEAGHEVGGEDFVALDVLPLLHAWEDRLGQLEATAAEAQRRGHVEVAAIFQRQKEAARARIDLLRQTLAKARA